MGVKPNLSILCVTRPNCAKDERRVYLSLDHEDGNFVSYTGTCTCCSHEYNLTYNKDGK